MAVFRRLNHVITTKPFSIFQFRFFPGSGKIPSEAWNLDPIFPATSIVKAPLSQS
jgi:hypothetical protein